MQIYMANKDYSIRQEQLARFAKAMGHPARIAILQFLAKQETCYFGDIHEELPIAKATVSQHLKELKDAGLIQGEVEAPKVKYCIIGWLIKNISYICDIKNENIMAFSKAEEFEEKDILAARFAKALSHPARIAIVRLLANHNACCYCGDLTTELPIAQSTISQHLKVLKDVGLIDGEIAPPKVCYRINPENLLLAKKLFSELL